MEDLASNSGLHIPRTPHSRLQFQLPCRLSINPSSFHVWQYNFFVYRLHVDSLWSISLWDCDLVTRKQMVLGLVFKFDSVSLSQLKRFLLFFVLFCFVFCFLLFFFWGGGGVLRRGVTVGTSVFLACHQCYCAGMSLAWGLNLRALVCGIFWSSLPGGFLLPSPDSAFVSHGHLFSHSS